MYGSETWPVKVADMQRLVRTERMMVRWMCAKTLKDRSRSEELRGCLGIEGVADVVRRGRLRWFGHVERKRDDDWVSACRNIKVGGSVGRGRSRKTWEEVIKGDLEAYGLDRKDAKNRDLWRSSIVWNRPTRASMEKRTLNR